MARRIAIVEDEPAIRDNYTDALRAQGYHVEGYGDRGAATAAFASRLPDLVLLDIGLADDVEGGFELCRTLRAMSATLPILFLTARDSDLDAISGLRLGADDYLTKDISLEHLCARIAAFFRRMDAQQQAGEQPQPLLRGDLAIDTDRLSVSWRNQPLELTLTEFWLVHSLALHPGHVRNREQLMRDARIVVDDATITSHVKRIRRKFETIDAGFSCIDTVYGMGYRWLER
jgi:two-component system OmpR family response regulator